MLRKNLMARFVFVVAAIALSTTWAFGQTMKGLAVQKARDHDIQIRGEKTFYPPDKFDLVGLAEYRPDQQVSGTIRLWGNNYIKTGRLGEYWEAEFHKYQPGIKFDNHGLTTSLVAIPGLYTGVADLGMARKIRFGELEAFERQLNYDPLEIDAVTGSVGVPGWSPALPVLVNKSNPISQLTIEQLDGIFGAQRDGGWVGTTWHPEFARGADKNIRTWGQLGLTGKWKDKPIHVWVYNLRYDTTPFWEDVVFQGGNKWNETCHEATNYVNADGTFNLQGKQIDGAVGSDPYAIGYTVGAPKTPDIKYLKISARNGGSYVPINLETVRNRTYPLYEGIYFYVNRPPGQPIDPKVKEFLSYILSRQGQQQVENDGKYLPLTADVVREQLNKLK